MLTDENNDKTVIYSKKDVYNDTGKDAFNSNPDNTFTGSILGGEGGEGVGFGTHL